ncbi:non-heme iron oxygenase ferredoxin subunit [soil metagenome]
MPDEGNGDRHEPTSDALVELGDLSGLRDGQLRVFPELGRHGVVVCRVVGQLHAVEDNCSHREARLSEGRLRGSLLTCALHGAQFDVRTGAQQGPPAPCPIASFPVTESDGSAWVQVGDSASSTS